MTSLSQTALSQWQKFMKQTGNSEEGVAIDGKSLDISTVVAVARHGKSTYMTDKALHIMQESIDVVQRALEQGKVVYGVNTGFGGSADTRILETNSIQSTIVQELHCGILTLPTTRESRSSPAPLPLSDAPTCMPESWVRAAMLLRVNSLACGYSGVRPILVESILHLLKHDIIPLVPLRGSISASGDLMPLSYIAGAIQGSPQIQVWSGAREKRMVVSADVALSNAGLSPVTLGPKEGLAIVNGTAVSTGVAALAMQDVNCLAVLSQILTSMSVEALLGSKESFDPFFAQVRSHPGQTEAAHNIYSFLSGSLLAKSGNSALDDNSLLYQDRYSIRTASQWIGPVLEDFQLAYQQVSIECNSVTDNPLVDTRESVGRVLNGGNFQARAITSAMEKTRQGIQTIGQMLFTQCTELMNTRLSQGLPPNLAADDPSSSWLLKPLDILTAALQSELGFLSNSAGSHVQPAEMGNQALNSLALISARYTHTALDILSQLAAAHLVALCQALDLRALQRSFLHSFEPLLRAAVMELLDITPNIRGMQEEDKKNWDAIWIRTKKLLDETVSLESNIRFQTILESLQPLIFNAFPATDLPLTTQYFLISLQIWTQVTARKATECYISNRRAYFDNPSASPLLGMAAGNMYKFVRDTLEVPFLRREIMDGSQGKHVTVGECVSIVYAAIRDGRLFTPVMDCLSRVDYDTRRENIVLTAPIDEQKPR